MYFFRLVMCIPYLGFRFPVFNIYLLCTVAAQKSCQVDWTGLPRAENCDLRFKPVYNGKLTASRWQKWLHWFWLKCRMVQVTEIWERAQERLSLVQTRSERTSCCANCIPWPVGIHPAQQKLPSGLQRLWRHKESPPVTQKSHSLCSSAWTTAVTFANWFGSFPKKGKIALQVKGPSKRCYPGLDRPSLLQDPPAGFFH